ncbi:MAG TPA: hypothetical protein VNS63_08285 [Blastocatellia bacterium]|nr:hypothetical protein [Blastocatellia bacterium]
MRSKLASFLLILSLMVLALPAAAQAQSRDGFGGIIRRDKNGVRVGDSRITLFDGPGIVNYKYKERWMPGAGGAATVIGIGAGAGAGTGAIVKGKKGAVVGALIGGGAATGLWLYKNRTVTRRIF